MGIEIAFPYLLYYLWVIILFYSEKNKGLILSSARILEFIGFFIFFGLRGYVYSDGFQYYLMFNALPGFPDMTFESFSLGERSMEPLFQILIKIVKIFSNNYIVFQCVNSVIDFILLDKVFRRYNKYYTLGFLLLPIFYGFLIEINLLRNFKAILLFFISLQYVKERKLNKFIFIILLASLFHPTALLYIPLYWVVNKKWPKFVVLGILFMGAIFPLLDIRIFSNIFELPIFRFLRFSSYADRGSYSLGLRSIERIVFYILLLRYYYKDDEYRIFYNLYFIFFFCFNCMYEFEIFVIRVSMLFIPYWFIIDKVYVHLSKQKRNLFLNFIIMFGFIIVYIDNSVPTSRYTNVIFNEVDYYTSRDYFKKYIDE